VTFFPGEIDFFAFCVLFPSERRARRVSRVALFCFTLLSLCGYIVKNLYSLVKNHYDFWILDAPKNVFK
jgi:hypothetical protein